MYNDFYFSGYTENFSDVWPALEDFISDYNSAKVGFYTVNNVEKKPITDESLTLLYSLLFARYGFSTIANINIEQFKYAVYSRIFMYGPTWEERVKLQRELINISDDELREGTKAIYNHAFNPSTTPSTSTMNELPFVNDQNTTKYKKSKMDAIAFKWDLLKTDVTKSFLDRFEELFVKVLSPVQAIKYTTYEGE